MATRASNYPLLPAELQAAQQHNIGTSHELFGSFQRHQERSSARTGPKTTANSRVCLTRHLPLPPFLTTSGAFTSEPSAALFHAAAALRISITGPGRKMRPRLREETPCPADGPRSWRPSPPEGDWEPGVLPEGRRPAHNLQTHEQPKRPRASGSAHLHLPGLPEERSKGKGRTQGRSTSSSPEFQGPDYRWRTRSSQASVSPKRIRQLRCPCSTASPEGQVARQ